MDVSTNSNNDDIFVAVVKQVDGTQWVKRLRDDKISVGSRSTTAHDDQQLKDMTRLLQDLTSWGGRTHVRSAISVKFIDRREEQEQESSSAGRK